MLSKVDLPEPEVPMKLAAAEGLYEGKQGAGLVVLGVLNPAKEKYDDGVDPFLFRWEAPKVLSLLANRDLNSFVPGVKDQIEGGYTLPDGSKALSAQEKIEKGRLAIAALGAYRAAHSVGNDLDAKIALATLKDNMPYFGYGYIKDAHADKTIPLAIVVPLTAHQMASTPIPILIKNRAIGMRA